jgi:hypothetical protein
MNRKLIYLVLLAISVSSLYAQKPGTPVIKGDYYNLPFDQFASRIKTEHGIQIFYLDEWVDGLHVTASGDSIGLDTLLVTLLTPRGINFYYRGGGQYYLTGYVKIDDQEFKKIAGQIEKERDETPPESTLFGKFSYAKTIHRVTIGSRDNMQVKGNALLSGKISSINSGEPVIGATVTVEGTTTGTFTNGEGFFALQVKPGGVYNLTVNSLGMEKESYIVEVNSSGTLNIEMNEQLIDIQEVVVRSGRHDNVRGMQMGFQKIDIKEIRSIPVVMGERDIIKIAQMMPGVQSVGEGSSGFNVRGSAIDQNLFLLNGIPILNTGHLFGFFSAFNPDMVSEFNLYKSNFPAEYGGRLASVFEVSTRKGNKKRFGARGAISPVTGSLLLETPIIKDKVSLIIGGRSTYSDWILRRLDNRQLRESGASFYDIMSGVHVILDESSSLQLFGYFSHDRFRLGGTNRYRYENTGSSASYIRKLNEKWTVDLSAIYSSYLNYNSASELPSSASEHEFSVDHKGMKVMFKGYKWINHTTTLGAGAIHYTLDQGTKRPYGQESILFPVPFGREQGIEYNIYAADEFDITHRVSVYGGLRFSMFSFLGPNDIYTYPEAVPREAEFITDTVSYGRGRPIKTFSGPEFRFSLNYEVSPSLSIKGSYNKMRQYLFMLSNTIAMSPTDRWKLADPYISPPIADQVSIGIYRNIPKGALETSAEVYYKKTRNHVDYKDGADLSGNPRFETTILQGDQNSWGAEFLIKRNAGRLTGWISYAWSRSLVTVNGRNEWEKINDGLTYPANYDKPHSVNLVGNLRFSRRVSLASNMVYSTGRPITYPTGIIWIGGEQGIIYSNRNEYRIPDYFRVDVSLNVEGNLRRQKVAHGSWMFAIYNATGRRNAYSVYFKNEGGMIKGYKQSIYGVPIFTVSYNFKFGNYAVD